MVRLIDFLDLCNVKVNRLCYKIHLATRSNATPDESPDPLEAYFDGQFKEWQEIQTKKNFSHKCEMVVSLIHLPYLHRHKWLFVGVYKVLGCVKIHERRYRYSSILLDGQINLIGRLIVTHEKKWRQSYPFGLPNGGDFYISEIREQPMLIGDFPGYNSVLLSFRNLNTIISQNIQSWYGALSNIKGVYLITDTSTGNHYVGSAYGDVGLWQRFSHYTKNGHGGNKELRNLLQKNGDSHKNYFQYSILEIADSRASDEYILSRESHWKKVLMSREFGLNSN